MANGGQGGDHMIGANVASQFLAGWDWVTPYPPNPNPSILYEKIIRLKPF